jgi:hypothetical protein
VVVVLAVAGRAAFLCDGDASTKYVAAFMKRSTKNGIQMSFGCADVVAQVLFRWTIHSSLPAFLLFFEVFENFVV